MRIGGPIFVDTHSPEEWINALKARGYQSSYCPIHDTASPEEMESYRVTALRNDILISEVNARSYDLLSVDHGRGDIQTCIKRLRLAEGVGALCCVFAVDNQNMESGAVDALAKAIRRILDAVSPVRAFLVLEIGECLYPGNAHDFLHLMKVVDHPRFGVSLNLSHIEDVDECLLNLAPFIRSIKVSEPIPHDDELDGVLQKIDAINPDMCIMLGCGDKERIEQSQECLSARLRTLGLC